MTSSTPGGLRGGGQIRVEIVRVEVVQEHPGDRHGVAVQLAAAGVEEPDGIGAIVAEHPVHVLGHPIAGRPGSMTCTERRARPSTNAALNPGAAADHHDVRHVTAVAVVR